MLKELEKIAAHRITPASLSSAPSVDHTSDAIFSIFQEALLSPEWQNTFGAAYPALGPWLPALWTVTAAKEPNDPVAFSLNSAGYSIFPCFCFSSLCWIELQI